MEDDKTAYLQLADRYKDQNVEGAEQAKQDVDLETRLIFGLADMLKAFDPGKYYGTLNVVLSRIDMAERLYKRWEQTNLQDRASGVKRVLDKFAGKALSRAFHQLKLHATEKRAEKEPEELAAEPEPMSTPPVPAPLLKSRGSPVTSRVRRQETDVFQKLHAISRARQEVRKLNEKLKEREETKYCTFRPQTNSTPTHVRPTGDAYSRLSHSNKREMMKCLEAQKEARELQYCTFAPQIKHARMHSESFAQIEPIYTRLHRAGEMQEQLRRTKEVEHKEHELDGCTFSPQTNSACKPRKRSSSLTSRDQVGRHERLYQDHARQRRESEKHALDQEEALQAGCTFRPALVSRQGTEDSAGEDPTPRYERLYARHMQKQQMLEKKRKELAEEERKMHQIVSGMKGTTKPKSKKARAGSVTARSMQLSPRPNARNDDGFRSARKFSGDAFERLYNLHKDSQTRREQLGKRLLTVRSRYHPPR